MGWPVLVTACAAYLVGSVSPAILVGRYRGHDIRRLGSGNAGATNVARNLGKSWGLLVLALDVLKGVLVSASVVSQTSPLMAAAEGRAAAGLLVVAGHCFPVFHRFRGGKGVATALGVFLVMCPQAAGVAMLSFGLTFAWRKRVSLASLVASLVLVGAVFYFVAEPWFRAMSVAVVALVIFRHRGNIRRLRANREPGL